MRAGPIPVGQGLGYPVVERAALRLASPALEAIWVGDAIPFQASIDHRIVRLHLLSSFRPRLFPRKRPFRRVHLAAGNRLMVAQDRDQLMISTSMILLMHLLHPPGATPNTTD